MTTSSPCALFLPDVKDIPGSEVFARQLVDQYGFKFLSVGRAANHLINAGIPVIVLPQSENSPFEDHLTDLVSLHFGLRATDKQLAASTHRKIDLVYVTLNGKALRDEVNRYQNGADLESCRALIKWDRLSLLQSGVCGRRITVVSPDKQDTVFKILDGGARLLSWSWYDASNLISEYCQHVSLAHTRFQKEVE